MYHVPFRRWIVLGPVNLLPTSNLPGRFLKELKILRRNTNNQNFFFEKNAKFKKKSQTLNFNNFEQQRAYHAQF